MAGITTIIGITGTIIGIDRSVAIGLPRLGWGAAGRYGSASPPISFGQAPSVSLRETPPPDGEDFCYILRPIQISLPMTWTSARSAG
jgi:hypothetical protein